MSALHHSFRRGGAGRLVFATWLGVYPVLTLIAVLLQPWLTTLAVWTQTLIMSALMVPIMVLIVMPGLKKLL